MSEQNRSARSRYEAARAAFDAAFERHLDAGVEFVSRDGICIDPEVEIAPGVLILPGTILRGKTRIGAGSVITRDIPPGVVAAGNPCRVLRPVTDADRMDETED